MREAPVSLSPIDSVFEVYYGQVSNFQFEFANPLVINSVEAEAGG